MNKYAVIGTPISQSKSPQMFNAAFKHLGINAKYEAIEVSPDNLNDFVLRLHNQEFSGINITIPHKQTIIPYLDKLTSLAKSIGAVNIVYVKDNKLIGDNTDAYGFIEGLQHETKINFKNKNATVIGAGGASLAVCFALCQENINSLTIYNRTLDKAHALIKKLSPLFTSVQFEANELSQMTAHNLENCHLLVNTTSLGMNEEWPNLDFLNHLPKNAFVSDIVAHPIKTPLIKKANDLQLTVNHGYTMLLNQAIKGFEIFTDKKAPIKIMKKALLKDSE